MKNTLKSSCLLLLLTAPSVIAGSVTSESAILTASDGAVADNFAWSVGLSGTIAIVGAPNNDASNTNSGGAYLFDLTTGEQLFKLVPADPQFNDTFGQAVAISGNLVIAGSPGDDDNGPSSGSAYIFDALNGAEIGKLLASDGDSGDAFGRAVAVHGNIAAIGAPKNDIGSAGDGGAAYIFDLTTGEELFQLLPITSSGGAEFGTAIDLDGNHVVVGASSRSVDGMLQAGIAYVFDAATGEQSLELVPQDPGVRDRFGWSVAISEQFVAVGSRWDDDNGLNSGSVYIFDAETGQELRKITPNEDDAAEFDEFGFSVDIEGTTLIVGSTQTALSGTGPGVAYAFDIETGEQITKFVASDAQSLDDLGFSVAISEGTILSGAAGRSSDTGAVYVFEAELSNCPADVNNSGSVDLADLNIVLANFGQATTEGDADSSGTVDLADLNLILAAFGTDCP